jgi:hypothetical protein
MPMGAVLAPEQHPDPGTVAAGTDEIRHGSGEMGKVFRGDDFGARPHDQIAKALGKTDFCRARFVAAAWSPGGAAPVGGGVGVGKIYRSALRAKQRNHLPQRQVEDFIEIEGLRCHHRHRVQRVEFTVAAAHFVFGSALLGHVQNESLIAFDFPAASRVAKLLSAASSSVPFFRRMVTSKLRT